MRPELELVMVEQSVLSAAEEQALLDQEVPVVGLLGGTMAVEHGCMLLQALARTARDVEGLARFRRVYMAEESIEEMAKRMKEEGLLVCGYYYTETGNSIFSIDHAHLQDALTSIIDLEHAVMLRIRRILTNSPNGAIDASIRCDLYSLPITRHGAKQETAQQQNCLPNPPKEASSSDLLDGNLMDYSQQHTNPTLSTNHQRIYSENGNPSRINISPLSFPSPQQQHLVCLPFRILDTAYWSPTTLRLILHSQTVDYREMAALRRISQRHGQHANNDVQYDMALSRLLVDLDQRRHHLLHNEQGRVASSKLHIKSLLRARLLRLEQLWSERHPGTADSTDANPSSTAPSEDTPCLSSRSSALALLCQMIGKEIPTVQADLLRRLPIVQHLHFYERPSIIVKSTRPSNVGPSARKKLKSPAPHKNGVAKGPPRPILPAGASLAAVAPTRTSSIESLPLPTTERPETKIDS